MKIAGLIDLLDNGSRVSLEKIQKGKDDALDLIYRHYQTTEPPIDHPSREPLADECIVWSGYNYTGTEVSFINNPKLNTWTNHTFAEMPLGSWKCGPNVRVWF